MIKEEISIEFDMEARKNSAEVKHAVSIVTASSDKLKALGWKANVTLEDACRRMMKYYDIETDV